jgi:uncharacterized pyridoxamine 5'-phosphate oxidase family protein
MNPPCGLNDPSHIGGTGNAPHRWIKRLRYNTQKRCPCQVEKGSSDNESKPMINIIHYDDDIFFLTAMVKRLFEGLKLELDSSLFLNKILEEIAFISRSIEHFMESLKSTKLKVNRLNYLKNMYKLNTLFIEMLNAVLTEQVAFAQNMKNHFPHLTTLRDRHLDHESALKDELNAGKSPGGQDHEVLSEEEYKILLSPDDEE